MQLARNDNLSWEDDKSQMTNKLSKLIKSPSAFRTVTANEVGCKTEDPKQLDPTSLCGKDHNTFSWQEHGTKSSQILPSATVPQSALLEKYTVMQPSTGNQCVCVSGFKQIVPESDVQKHPSSVSSLFSGQFLSSTAFTQPHFGNVNQLAAFSGGNTGLYGASTGYHGCNFPTHNIQNTVTGVPLSANIGPGLLATLPMSSYTATKQNIDHHIHLIESQSGTDGLSQWAASRMSSGFGKYIHNNFDMATVFVKVLKHVYRYVYI